MLDVLFCGYFGFGNLGDEVILSAVVEDLYRSCPDARLGVLVGPRGSRLPAATSQIPRADRAAMARALTTCRVLAVGPGGIFQDATSVASCAWYGGVVARARRAGARVVHVAQSVGPLRSLPGRWLTRRALASADAVLVRDEASLELVRRLSCGDRAVRTADAGWLVPPPRGLLRERPARVALAPRPWGGRRGLSPAWWAELAGTLEAGGREVIGLAMSEEDARLLGEVARLTGRKAEPVRPQSAEEALALLGSCEAVVAMRLHALLLGARAECRVLGLSYDPKVDGLLAALGLEPAGRVGESPQAARIAALVGDPTWGRAPAARVEEEHVRARRNVEVLAGLIATAREQAAPGA